MHFIPVQYILMACVTLTRDKAGLLLILRKRRAQSELLVYIGVHKEKHLPPPES